MKKDFTGTTQTSAGHKTYNVRFNPFAGPKGGYIGTVEDPMRGGKPTACTWTLSGKCVNKLRPELNF